MNKLYLIVAFITLLAAAKAQNATFTQVGPVKFPDNPSVQTTGMGRVSQLVYHPTDSNIMFAVSASGGVFKSSNEGASWRPISDFLPQTACASLAINPLNPKVMFLGTGDANYNGGGLGVWKSNDGGNTWNQTTTGMGNRLVSYILYTPNDTNTLVAACSDGIYKSVNAGNSWTKKTTVSTSYRDLKYRPASNNIMYAATNTHFYRSYNNGETWIQSNINPTITCAGVKIGVCESDTARLYCVVWKSGAASPFGGLYKSVNNGTTFTLQVDTPNILGYSSDGSSLDGQGAYNLGIAVDPANANIIYVGGICIWKSTNQGVSFSLNSPWGYGVHADKHGFLFSPFNPKKLYIYHDGGIDRTLNGGASWTTMEDGLSASEFYKMGSSGLYNDYIIGGLQDNGMDVATNKKFSTVRGGDWTGDFVFDAFDSSLLYEYGGIKRNILNHSTGNINGQGGIYATHPKDSNVLFELTTNVFRSNDIRTTPSTNVTWNQISNISGNTAPRAIIFSKASYGTLYVAFNTQFIYRSDNVNATTPIFNLIATFPFNTGEQVRQMETYEGDSGIIYVLTNQSRIFRSNNKGNSWTNITKNLPAVTIIKFLIDQKATDSSMYACTAFGVYYRNKIIGNWISFSQGLPTVAQISDMEIMSDGTSNGRLHISTYGRGIWQTNLYKSNIIAPVADFVIQPLSSQTCTNTVILVDNSINSPTSRKWKIIPATGWNYINGTDSLSARAEIQFLISSPYFISLRVANSAGSDVITKNYIYSGILSAASCTTTTTNLGGYNIGIFRFELNNINKGSAVSNTSYQDFTCSDATFLRTGTTYTAWVTNGPSYNEAVKIYIDYNGNGVFTDANELVGSISNGLGRRSCTFTTLLNPPILNKFLRLRVVSDFGSVGGPCGTLGYGQSEDYAVNFDRVKPVVSISMPKPGVSNSFNATFTTTEIVSGFDVNDLTIGNGTVSNFSQLDAFTYSAKITPINNGKVFVGVKLNAFSDIAGNLNNAFTDSTLFFLGIKTFTFNGVSIKDSIVQSPTGGSVFCFVPYGTILDSLIATFTLSDSSAAFTGGVFQVTGVNKNNFKSPLIYTINSAYNIIAFNYLVTLIIGKNPECNLLNYGFVNPAVTGTITQTAGGGNIAVTVPFGTSLAAIAAYFTLSDSAKAYVNNVFQQSASSTNNFTTNVTYRIVAQDTNYTKTYSVNVTFGTSKSCDLLSFGIQNPSVTGVISPVAGGGNVSVILPFGTSLNALNAMFSVSDSAKVYINNVRQFSGVTTNNFSSVVTYKVVAHDTGYSKIYPVTVTTAPNIECKLLSYNILNPAATGVITNTPYGGIVSITVPFATNISALIAQFSLSDSARSFVSGVLQKSGVTPNNYKDTLLVTVIAQDGFHTALYKVVVSITPNTQCDLLSYKFVAPNVTGTITPSFNGGTVSIIVPFSTNLGSLVAEFTLSDSAKALVGPLVQVSAVTANDFNTPVTYTVKAQNNSSLKTYVVSVTKNTGLQWNGVMQRWTLYPTPAYALLTIDKAGLKMERVFYTITDMLGHAIKTGELREDINHLNISALAAGVYYFKIQTNTGYEIQKFVKE